MSGGGGWVGGHCDKLSSSSVTHIDRFEDHLSYRRALNMFAGLAHKAAALVWFSGKLRGKLFLIEPALILRAESALGGERFFFLRF